MTDDTTDTTDSTTDSDDSERDATTDPSATTGTAATTAESSDESRTRRDDSRSEREDSRSEREDSRSEREDSRSERDDSRPRAPRGGAWANATLRERLQWVALVVLVLVAVATLFSFYTNVSRFISIWATREYEPALQAAFALAVLATSLAGIARLSRNLN